MTYKFTNRANKAIEIANDIALELGHSYIGTEHILYGLAKEENGIASKVLENQNVTADDITVRILNPYKKAKLYVFDGNSWVELEYNTKGSYVETTMHGTQAQFCLVNKAVDPMFYIMIGAGAFAVIALVVMIKLIHVCRKKRKSMSDKKEEE